MIKAKDLRKVVMQSARVLMRDKSGESGRGYGADRVAGYLVEV